MAVVANRPQPRPPTRSRPLTAQVGTHRSWRDSDSAHSRCTDTRSPGYWRSSHRDASTNGQDRALDPTTHRRPLPPTRGPRRMALSAPGHRPPSPRARLHHSRRSCRPTHGERDPRTGACHFSEHQNSQLAQRSQATDTEGVATAAFEGGTAEADLNAGTPASRLAKVDLVDDDLEVLDVVGH